MNNKVYLTSQEVILSIILGDKFYTSNDIYVQARELFPEFGITRAKISSLLNTLKHSPNAELTIQNQKKPFLYRLDSLSDKFIIRSREVNFPDRLVTADCDENNLAKKDKHLEPAIKWFHQFDSLLRTVRTSHYGGVL